MDAGQPGSFPSLELWTLNGRSVQARPPVLEIAVALQLRGSFLFIFHAEI